MTHRPDIDTARHPSSANLCADHSDTAADIGTGIRYEIASTELTASQFESKRAFRSTLLPEAVRPS